MASSDKPDFAALQKALDEAEVNYGIKKDAAIYARMAETTALNELRQAQKDFDAAIEQRRKASPVGSHWSETRVTHKGIEI